jgi:peptidyl-prolyl cis-trans isomerase D
MLKLLRKKGIAKKILWAVAVMIILSFTLWGTGSMMQNGGKKGYTYAGKIFGKKISFEDYDHAYRATVMQAMLRYGDQFNEVRDYLDLGSEAWDRLLLLHDAKRKNVKVTDKEVVQYISSLPYFQSDGQFDKRLYEMILQRAFRISTRTFEEYMRENRKIMKLYELETSPFIVTDQEAFEAFKQKNEKVQVSYVFLPFEKYKEQAEVDASKAEEFYSSNKDRFARPASVTLNYVTFDKPELPEKEAKTAEGTEGTEGTENSEPIDEQKASELTAEQAAQIESVKNKAQTFQEEATAAGDIKIAAEDNKVQVLSTGSFNMDKPNLSLGWPYEILYLVFQMGQNDILPVFETDEAFVVAQVSEKREPFVPPFNEVKEEVIDQMKLIEARSLAQAKAIEIAEKVKSIDGKDFNSTAKDLGHEISQTPLFVRGDYLPQIGISAEFQETAFSLTEENPVSGPVQTQKGFAILHRDDYEGVSEEAFTAEKEELKSQLLAAKQNEAFSNYLSQLRIESRLEDNISKMQAEQN